MAKQKKKRNKVYRGKDSVSGKPNVVRIQAANRSRIGQWWFDKKRVAKPVLIATGVVGFIVLIITEIIRLISG